MSFDEKELKNVLEAHFLKYPLMQAEDYVKLLYQNEFAGGHMISDRAAALDFLKSEYEQVKNTPSQQRYESIGNSIVRADIRCFSYDELPLLLNSFCKTANEHVGTVQSFLEKLDFLYDFSCERGIFDENMLSRVLTTYKKAGCPSLHHSDVYRKVYKPAYRVISEDLCF